MDIKRLENIKSKTSFAGDLIEYLETKDYEWLVEQVEKLESIANTWVRIETSEGNEDTGDFYNEVQDILSEIE